MYPENQKLYEYMIDLNLDPFKKEDLVEAGRRLLPTNYNVPIEVMDQLRLQFMAENLYREIAFPTIQEFRMRLLMYFHTEQPRYEAMFSAFHEMNPFEFFEQVIETNEEGLRENTRQDQMNEIAKREAQRTEESKRSGTDLNKTIGQENNTRSEEEKANELAKDKETRDTQNTDNEQRSGNVTTRVDENGNVVRINRDTESAIKETERDGNIVKIGDDLLKGNVKDNTVTDHDTKVTDTGKDIETRDTQTSNVEDRDGNVIQTVDEHGNVIHNTTVTDNGKRDVVNDGQVTKAGSDITAESTDVINTHRDNTKVSDVGRDTETRNTQNNTTEQRSGGVNEQVDQNGNVVRDVDGNNVTTKDNESRVAEGVGSVGDVGLLLEGIDNVDNMAVNKSISTNENGKTNENKNESITDRTDMSTTTNKNDNTKINTNENETGTVTNDKSNTQTTTGTTSDVNKKELDVHSTSNETTSDNSKVNETTNNTSKTSGNDVTDKASEMSTKDETSITNTGSETGTVSKDRNNEQATTGTTTEEGSTLTDEQRSTNEQTTDTSKDKESATREQNKMGEDQTNNVSNTDTHDNTVISKVGSETGDITKDRNATTNREGLSSENRNLQQDVERKSTNEETELETDLETTERDQTSSGSLNENTRGNTEQRTKGMVIWKPELAFKFHQHYIGINQEWVAGTRDLFMYVY